MENKKRTRLRGVTDTFFSERNIEKLCDYYSMGEQGKSSDMKYLIIFNADAGTHIAEVVIEVGVDNADELRGEIELRGEEISEERGLRFECVGVEEVEEE